MLRLIVMAPAFGEFISGLDSHVRDQHEEGVVLPISANFVDRQAQFDTPCEDAFSYGCAESGKTQTRQPEGYSNCNSATVYSKLNGLNLGEVRRSRHSICTICGYTESYIENKPALETFERIGRKKVDELNGRHYLWEICTTVLSNE